MDASEKLYYALGQLCYVMACADGEIQTEERDRLEDLVQEKSRAGHIDSAYTKIIFLVLQKEEQDSKTVYKMAMKTLEGLHYFFNDDLKARFLMVLKEIAEAFPPNTTDETSLYHEIKTKFESLSKE